MPFTQDDPLTLFSLVPHSKKAAQVLVLNQELRSSVEVSQHSPESMQYATDGLNIGMYIPTRSRCTLATLGRAGDVVVDQQDISRVQCSFEIHRDTRNSALRSIHFPVDPNMRPQGKALSGQWAGPAGRRRARSQ